jgi:phosphatidylglycerol:prolipoprotein diacylglycerol transferase
MVRMARRFGENPAIIGNGLIIIAIAALLGGRLYHVIDQWQLYKDDLLKIVLPPYSGLGIFGGFLTGALAFLVLVRYYRVSAWRWADIVAPGIFLMQAAGRLGNFFNQELYGPPTSLPWGIAIDCEHRVAAYPCDTYPVATTGFHSLFLYESLSGVIGAVVLLWLARRPNSRLVRGDLLLIFLIWYGTTRFVLEFMRTGNWTFCGIATAQIVSAGFILAGLVGLWYRHGPGRPAPEAEPVAIDEDDEDDDDWDDDEDDFDDDEDDFDDDDGDGDDDEEETASAAPPAAAPPAPPS